jgi:hypothetical protein
MQLLISILKCLIVLLFEKVNPSKVVRSAAFPSDSALQYFLVFEHSYSFFGELFLNKACVDLIDDKMYFSLVLKEVDLFC